MKFNCNKAVLMVCVLVVAVLLATVQCGKVFAYNTAFSSYDGTNFQTGFADGVTGGGFTYAPPFSGSQPTVWSAYQFTSEATGVLSSVIVSLMGFNSSSGVNEIPDPSADILVYYDNNGQLGSVMTSWSVTNITTSVIHNYTFVNNNPAYILYKGLKYWVSVQPHTATSLVSWYYGYGSGSNPVARYMSPPAGSGLCYAFTPVPATMLVSLAEEAVAPGAPEIGAATAGNASAKVAFSAPASDGGAVISVYRATCASSNGGTGPVAQNGTASPITVTGLTNGKLYTCVVAAENSVGWSVDSASSNSFTPALPVAPDAPVMDVALAGDSGASVSFSAPASDGRAAIDNYRATCVSSNGGAGPVTGTGTTSPLAVTGMTNGKLYTCTMAAHNSVGWSAESSASNSFTPSSGQFMQQGPKLVGSGVTGTMPYEGNSVALSADGNTAIVGGYGDSSNTGAAWIFTRSSGAWSQQGTKLVGTGAVAASSQGNSVALSADGTTAIVGGNGDSSNVGAAWVFTRSNGVWSQQGTKLVGTGYSGTSNQGYSVALSADGNTAVVGGYGDSSNIGAVWVYTRSNGVWSQKTKLTASDATSGARQGYSVALSADGSTILAGGFYDNSGKGAAWIYTLSNGIWSQQGTKLVGSGAVGNAQQGCSVALSADGNTAVIGGSMDSSSSGAVWVFTRTSGVWSQQGTKLTGSDATSGARQGVSVAVSGDGATILTGGFFDNAGIGAAWVYICSNGTWSQQGTKLLGSDAVGTPVVQGNSVTISTDGATALVGGPYDNSRVGATWVYSRGSGAHQVIYLSPTSTGGSAPVDNNTYAAGSSVTVLGNTDNLARNGGYSFGGWNTAADGSGVSYAGGAVFSMGTADVILYAQWTAPLTVTINGSGGGSVTSAPPGITCLSGSSAGCSAPFPENSTVTLTSAPDWKSLLSAGSGTATIQMSAAKSETVTFVPNQRVMLMTPVTLFASLGDAYGAVTATGSAIIVKAQAAIFQEDLQLTKAFTLMLNGGMDNTYVNAVGFTTLKGQVIVNYGALIANNLVIE